MKSIGITGGVGAGKSELLAYIKKKYNCYVILADEVAHRLEKPGEECYNKLTALLGKEILKTDGTIDKNRMAEKIFADKAILEQVNAIVHPAVKKYIVNEIAKEQEKARIDFLFVEAALLIEDGYEEILDELWYIHTDTGIRRERLKASRAYSDEKIDHILQGQLSEETFRTHCRVVIDNSSDFIHTCQQIDEKLEEYLCQR
ncbi:MAG: dephospho-CoA kinase [Roseburia sp.]|nr:dephospho-CoA kinase [Ruminococcus sp.]MCM1155800.1 dephospho-CoA kinase [Roseburia sp.]MCM1242720.1 dephospho-CoA kinase [Roseburia sp.]